MGCGGVTWGLVMKGQVCWGEWGKDGWVGGVWWGEMGSVYVGWGRLGVV